MRDQNNKSNVETTPHEPRWRRRKDDRPREIMDAALEMFLERGFAATRLEDIATKASVTKGTLFIYFENKEDLYKSLVRENMKELKAFQEENKFDIHISSQETLLFLTNNWWKSVANSDYGKLPKLIVSEAANFPDITKEYLEEVSRPGRAGIAEIVRRGVESGEFRKVDPALAARVIMAPLFMLLIWRYSVAPFDEDALNEIEYVNTHIKMAIQGLLARPSAA